MCPSYLPSFPSTSILRVKSSDPKLTVNWLVMVAKPADINQSDFLLVYQRRLFFLFCPGLSSDPVVIPFLKLKKLDYGQMYRSEIHRHILDRTRRRKKKAYYQYCTREMNAGCNDCSFSKMSLFNSALMVEIRSLSQLSLVFRNA